MIDLSYRNEERGSRIENEDAPIGVVILGCLPFAVGFMWMVFQGLLSL